MLNTNLEAVLVVLLSVLMILIVIAMIYRLAEACLELYCIVTKKHYDIDEMIENAIKRIRRA